MYSKQYCDIWDNELTPDFDIETIAKDMYHNRYYIIECKGLNIFCIHKDIDGDLWVSHREDDGYYMDRCPSDWERLTDLINGEKHLKSLLREALQTI